MAESGAATFIYDAAGREVSKADARVSAQPLSKVSGGLTFRFEFNFIVEFRQ